VQDSQESVAVPLLGKTGMSVFVSPSLHGAGAGATSHEVLPSQTVTPRHTFQPHLRIKTSRATSRVTSRSVAAAAATTATDADNTNPSGINNNKKEAFGSRALAHQSGGESEPVAAEPSSATLENSIERLDSCTAHSESGLKAKRMFTFSPGEFSGWYGPENFPDDDGKSTTHTRDTSLLGDLSPDGSPGSRSRSPEQYPATPRSPRTPQDMIGEEDDDRDHENGMDDDRFTMISQPTDTQSTKSYYRVFGNRYDTRDVASLLSFFRPTCAYEGCNMYRWIRCLSDSWFVICCTKSWFIACSGRIAKHSETLER
jgi:hypothetical protein